MLLVGVESTVTRGIMQKCLFKSELRLSGSVFVVNHDDKLSKSEKEHVLYRNSCEEVSLNGAVNYNQGSRLFCETN